jgi:hypothetical protein
MASISCLQLGDAVADLAAVELGMRFAGTAAADAAALPALRPGQLGGLAQARRHVAEAGDLDLRPGRARAALRWKISRMTMVRSITSQPTSFLQIARLRGRDFVVDQASRRHW